MRTTRKSDIKITLTKDSENEKELTFTSKDGVDRIKMSITTCFGETEYMTVRFSIRPAGSERCLCQLLACYSLIASVESLKIGNKKLYAEKMKTWFDERRVNFPSDKECVIEMITAVPALVRLKSAVHFVVEAVVSALLTGLASREEKEKLDKKFKNWITETFADGYVIQTIEDRRQKNKKE